MSADYDRLFHSPDSVRTVDEDPERDTQPTGRDGAAPPPIPVVPPRTQATTATPPRLTEVTSRIPPIQATAPQRVPDNGMMRIPQNSLPSGARYEQQHPAPAAAPCPAPTSAPTSAPSQRFNDGEDPGRPVAPSAPTLAATMGNHRAIDALSHVGVRSAVKMPPQRGWRHWVYLLTRINLGLSPDELHEMDLHARIRRNARDSYQIGVFGLKGGVGKTAVTVALGSALSRIRGDRILAIDADPGGGNLADRTGRQSAATIADLLTDKELHRYNDIRAYTSMNSSNLEVLSSEEYSAAPREFNDEDWQDATEIVSRYYNLVLADSGAGLFQPAARGVLSTVSGLVIVASASIDGARQAAVTVDWLRQNGYQDLLGRSCVVINHVVPGKPNVDVEDLVLQFERHVPPGRVIVLPWDRHIAAGTEIRLELLSKEFERKVVELAAALSDDFDRLERR
jgi:MinD-like ATPase involved in chromosome partitioning or flagellar assembly